MTSIEKQYWAGEFTDAELDALAIDKAPALDRFAAWRNLEFRPMSAIRDALPARLLLRADQMRNKRTKSKKPEQNEEKFCTKSREQIVARYPVFKWSVYGIYKTVLTILMAPSNWRT
jgi:hypothetical protein